MGAPLFKTIQKSFVETMNQFREKRTVIAKSNAINDIQMFGTQGKQYNSTEEKQARIAEGNLFIQALPAIMQYCESECVRLKKEGVLTTSAFDSIPDGKNYISNSWAEPIAKKMMAQNNLKNIEMSLGALPWREGLIAHLIDKKIIEWTSDSKNEFKVLNADALQQNIADFYVAKLKTTTLAEIVELEGGYRETLDKDGMPDLAFRNLLAEAILSEKEGGQNISGQFSTKESYKQFRTFDTVRQNVVGSYCMVKTNLNEDGKLQATAGEMYLDQPRLMITPKIMADAATSRGASLNMSFTDAINTIKVRIAVNSGKDSQRTFMRRGDRASENTLLEKTLNQLRLIALAHDNNHLPELYRAAITEIDSCIKGLKETGRTTIVRDLESFKPGLEQAAKASQENRSRVNNNNNSGSSGSDSNKNNESTDSDVNRTRSNSMDNKN